MASRKEQKEQARAARVAAEQAAATKAARARRLQIFGGAIAVAIIVVVVAIVVSTSGSGNKTTDHVQQGQLHDSQVEKIDRTVTNELKGIPQHGVVLGKPNAKVNMEYYGDLQCPICADFTIGITAPGASGPGGMPQFIANQVRNGDARVTYHSMCTATCSSTNPPPGGGTGAFENQQVAAYAAGAQNKFWNFAETFYREQGSEDSGYVTKSFIQNIAKQVPGLNVNHWTSDRKDPAYLSQVTADDKRAGQMHLPGTPSLIMVGPTGKEVLVNNGEAPPDYSQLVSAYKEVL